MRRSARAWPRAHADIRQEVKIEHPEHTSRHEVSQRGMSNLKLARGLLRVLHRNKRLVNVAMLPNK
eukprot:1607082-Pyramimonas_sp.AAC.1